MGEDYLGAEEIADLVKVFLAQEELLTYLSQQGTVGRAVVDWEDGLDVLPLAMAGRDAGAAAALGPGNEMVDGEKALGLESIVPLPRVVVHDRLFERDAP